MVRKLKYPQDLIPYPPGHELHRAQTIGASFLVGFSAQIRVEKCCATVTWEIYLSKVSWVFLINSKVRQQTWSYLYFLGFFLSWGKVKIKAEIMSPCQHLLWSAQVHGFECVDGYGMWQPLVSSEWLHALGKHSFLWRPSERNGEREGECCKHHLHIWEMSSSSSVQVGIERIHEKNKFN